MLKHNYCLEPQTTINKRLFLLDDEPNLYIGNGWKWLFGVPGGLARMGLFINFSGGSVGGLGESQLGLREVPSVEKG